MATVSVWDAERGGTGVRGGKGESAESGESGAGDEVMVKVLKPQGCKPKMGRRS
jgi:hypothetical protein